MNALSNPNPEAIFLTVPIACQKYNLGRGTVMSLAQEAGAVLRIGRCIRIDKEKFVKYVTENYAEQPKVAI